MISTPSTKNQENNLNLFLGQNQCYEYWLPCHSTWKEEFIFYSKNNICKNLYYTKIIVESHVRSWKPMSINSIWIKDLNQVFFLSIFCDITKYQVLHCRIARTIIFWSIFRKIMFFSTSAFSSNTSLLFVFL